MSILLADSTFGVTLSPDAGAPMTRVPCPLEAPYMPAIARDRLLICCRKSRDCCALSTKTGEPLCRMPAMPALSELCVSPCGRYAYQLGSESDAVHTRHLGTGELMYAAPVGVFPRTMRVVDGGRALLIAGGAADEAYILRAPELTRERVVYTRGACFAADVWQGGLVLACAVEGDDIQTAVYILPPRAVRPRLLITLPGQPGALRVCPDGQSALLSTPDGLMKLCLLSGRLIWNLPEWALCMRIHIKGGVALISDAINGQACLMWHEQPWICRVLQRGDNVQGALA